MDNGSGRGPMAETVYGTEDNTMVMSEKVKVEKSIGGGRGEERNHIERRRKVGKASQKIKLNNFLPYAAHIRLTSPIDIKLHTFLSLALCVRLFFFLIVALAPLRFAP